MPTGVDTPVVTVTTPCIHRQRANSTCISMRWISASCRFRPRLDTCGVVCFVFSFQRALVAPGRVPVHDWVGASGRPPSGRLVPRSGACQCRTQQRKETTQTRAVGARSTATSLRVRVVSCISPIFTHNEHPSCGLSDTRTLASDSPPRASRYGVVRARPGAPRPVPTGRDRAGRAPTNRLSSASSDSSDKDRERIGRAIYPRRPSLSAHLCRSPPAQRSARTRRVRPSNPRSCQAPLRRSSHGGSRSAPSRAALLTFFMAASSWACPLDRALCGRPAASVAEQRSDDWSTLLTAHFNSVWIRQREFAS